ncbi:MAG TPA: hypothetical protein VFD97_06365 [Acidimicrobiia bacterium]|nr:hypothetical protein [Acidimicrobiia bacterium]
MDDTQITELLDELAGMDPADAAEVAAKLAELLADRLEDQTEGAA